MLDLPDHVHDRDLAIALVEAGMIGHPPNNVERIKTDVLMGITTKLIGLQVLMDALQTVGGLPVVTDLQSFDNICLDHQRSRTKLTQRYVVVSSCRGT